MEYLGWETTYTEIVDSVRLRPKSVEPPITAHTFFSFKVVLPEEIKNFYSYLPEEKHADLHNDFKNAIHACKVEFIKGEGFSKVLMKYWFFCKYMKNVIHAPKLDLSKMRRPQK